LIDLFHVSANAESKSVFGKLADADAAPADGTSVNLTDAIAGNRFAQTGRKIERLAGGIGHLNDAVSQSEWDKDFLKCVTITIRSIEVLDVAEQLMRIHRQAIVEGTDFFVAHDTPSGGGAADGGQQREERGVERYFPA
jgi:hypothetical protein